MRRLVIAASFEQPVVGTASGQIGRDAPHRGFRPALGGLAVVDTTLDEGTRIIIGDLRIPAGVPSPVNVADEVAEDRVGSTREHEHELRQVGGGKRCGKPLEVCSRRCRLLPDSAEQSIRQRCFEVGVQ